MNAILNNKQLPRFLLSVVVLALYGFSPSELNQTLAAAVVFYWLGSSAGSFNKDERHNASH